MAIVPDPNFIVILLVAATAAGFVDTVGGGGGLITLPTLLLLQIPPLNALATNRLQAACGTLVAALTMWRKRVIRAADMPTLFVGSLLGSALGTAVIQVVAPRALDAIVPVILLLIAIYFLFAPGAGDVERHPRIGDKLYSCFVVPIIGFYDGALGPGAGSFFSLAGVSLKGQSLVRATAAAKILDFAANMSSLIIFALSGKVMLVIGAIMIVGQVFGAYLGSLVVIHGGAKWVRPIIVIVCCSMLARYLFQKGLISF